MAQPNSVFNNSIGKFSKSIRQLNIKEEEVSRGTSLSHPFLGKIGIFMGLKGIQLWDISN